MIAYNSRKPEGAEQVRLAATVGALLRGRREAAALSRTALSARCGVNSSTITAIEGGRSRPSWKTLVRLAAGLHPADPVRAAALAHDLADAAGPSLASDPTLPPWVARELFTDILTASMRRLGIDAEDDHVRAVVMEEIRAALHPTADAAAPSELTTGSA
ncbi:helix-turn-helix domain-containing protein [Dactylosporangium sp. CA-139066]|uniref:helix-turn-helix domain-containing protein n=1 Tax=Dactylosporangium sp. CA-139066 TaxID=3239930 RepID=UPI003D89C622